MAFELPKLPGLRKQAFHVVERVAGPPSRPGQDAPRRVPRRLAGKLAALLDAAGAVRLVANSRSRFLFETGPVLFFAELPSARLKQRAANKLRRDLVGMAVRACVLRSQPDRTTLMAWPAAETGITDFIDGAIPEHPIHPEFDAGWQAPVKRAGGPASAGTAPAPPNKAREARLLRQIAVLQGQVDALTRAQSAQGALEQLGLDDARLKSMLVLLHPDKHGSSEAANEAAKWVNSMRDLLRGRTTG